MPDVLPRLPVGCSCSWRYSRNQTAIFAPLTSVNRLHHQARGFDQARELDRARHSKLMIPNPFQAPGHAPRVTELTFVCSNPVTNRGQSRQKYLCGECLRGDGGVSAASAFALWASSDKSARQLSLRDGLPSRGSRLTTVASVRKHCRNLISDRGFG